LPEQELARLLGFLGLVPKRSLTHFASERKASLDRRSGANPLEPAFEAGKVCKLLALALIGHDPAPVRHIRDRPTPVEMIVAFKTSAEDAAKPLSLAHKAVDHLGN